MKKWQIAASMALAFAGTSGAAIGDAGIKAFTPATLQAIEQAHRGQPFVLVVWSLDCVYCKASLKYLAAESARRKFKVVTLATDAIEDAQTGAELRRRLDQAGMRGQAWAFGDDAPEQLRYAIDPNWYGELPRSYWYDARGARHAYSGMIDAGVLAKYMPR